LVAGVAAAALILSAAGWLIRPQVNWEGVAIFAVAAFLIEMFHADLFGDRAVSTSLAILFAAAIVLGVPGVVAVAAVVALIERVQESASWYKTLFDWGAHVVSGGIVALIVPLVPFALDVARLPQWLAVAVLLGAVFYASESGLPAAALGLSQGRRVYAIWRAQYRWLALHYLVLCVVGFFLAVSFALLGLAGVAVLALPVLMVHLLQKRNVDRAAQSSLELKHTTQELVQTNREVLAANQAFREINQELFLTLSRALDARDPYVSGHATQVARYSVAIAGELGLSIERVSRLQQAALLHDLGKVGIREQILNKPETLSDEEYDYVKEHAILGADLVSNSRALNSLAPFIRCHHERWDGTGYPDGLSGEQIPLEARILAVSDAIEAMASERPYHRAMPLSEIIAEIQRCAGTQFDPQVVAAFVNVAQQSNGDLVVNSARSVPTSSAAEQTARA
ncbi:MAG: HD-GYP domain-containing protein, partial [Rudaea sp.]